MKERINKYQTQIFAVYLSLHDFSLASLKTPGMYKCLILSISSQDDFCLQHALNWWTSVRTNISPLTMTKSAVTICILNQRYDTISPIIDLLLSAFDQTKNTNDRG